MATPSRIPAQDRLIVALDVPSADEARGIVMDLGDAVTFYKIGLQLFPVGGVELARELIASGKKVFLDFKFYDIGQTVHNAVVSVSSIGATFLTIHGDRAIVSSAVAGKGASDLKVLAVTVLTSMNEASLNEMGYSGSVADLVLARAKISLKSGCDGVIASAAEAARLRAELGPDFLIVTPGIRSAGIGHDDQKRVTTPGDAIRAGADYLVMGREITKAANRRDATRHVLEQIKAAV